MTANPITAATELQLGTAPDSWGVWFPDDPHEVPWQQFLDEAAAAGYTAVELGPYGYLPTHPEQLRDELGRRNLTLTGGTVGTHLHRGGNALAEGLAESRQVAALLAAMDAPYPITLPVMYTDLHTGRLLEPAEPHADAHVDRDDRIGGFLEGTDPATVSLCLDTGHVAYAGGDNRAIVAKYPDRIGYVHLKSINPDVVARVRAEGTSFAQAVKQGAMVEPTDGEPDMPPLLADLHGLGVPLWAIVAHDMYPAPADAPLPIAARTGLYYGSCGVRTGAPGRRGRRGL